MRRMGEVPPTAMPTPWYRSSTGSQRTPSGRGCLQRSTTGKAWRLQGHLSWGCRFHRSPQGSSK
eukprot:3843999-Alexandrium_andersonii.AAC.1